MIKLECPHCAAPLQRARITSGEPVNCEFCGGAFDVDDVAGPVDQVPIADQPTAQPSTTKTELAGLTGAALLALAAGVWRSKSPVAAAFLSVIWSGLGQIHNGQVAIGLALAAVQFVALAWLEPVAGWPLFVLIWSYSICNACACAAAARAGKEPAWDRGLTPALVGGGFVAAMLYLVADVKRADRIEQDDLVRITSQRHVDANGITDSGELMP